MENATKLYHVKRAEKLIKNLKAADFEACYCETREEALEKALEIIPEGSTVGWGGTVSAQQIGLMDAVNAGNYNALDRDQAATPEERVAIMRRCLDADYFITGANAMSLTGEMVNIDGTGNRVSAIVWGPKYIVVIAGINKVCDTLDDAVRRARTVASPMNKQRFLGGSPCSVSGTCADCKTPGCICNQLLITRRSQPAGRIKIIIVGEELGF